MKRKCWKELIDAIDNNMNSKTLWNTIKIISGGKPSKDNMHLLNNRTLSQQFMNLNFPQITDTINYSPKLGNFIKIDHIEIIKTIKSKKDHSTPGIDKLSFFI